MYVPVIVISSYVSLYQLRVRGFFFMCCINVQPDISILTYSHFIYPPYPLILTKNSK